MCFTRRQVTLEHVCIIMNIYLPQHFYRYCADGGRWKTNSLTGTGIGRDAASPKHTTANISKTNTVLTIIHFQHNTAPHGQPYATVVIYLKR